MVGGLDASAGDASPAGRHVCVYIGTDVLEAVQIAFHTNKAAA